ncbi:N-acetylmuramoyl-L-alanine amidase [Prauserella oleivorans]
MLGDDPSATEEATASAVAPTAGPDGRAPVVVLDPGHNGGNDEHLDAIDRRVPAGRGETKPCNTTGTASDDDYPEHTFNYAVAERARQTLEARGVRVVLTRDGDDGVGPCVDERAAIGNRTRAAAVVSIHADGAPADARGFHVIYSHPPLNAAQGEPTHRLANALVTSLSRAGLPKADYVGGDGLDGRDDLAGLNLSERPAVLVECGNMRNEQEAELMSSPRGHRLYGDAIARGVLAYLDR